MALQTQALMVASLVAACFGYSAWALMPAMLRRKLATVLTRMPWVGQVPAVVRAAKGPVGCGCDGCDRSTLAKSPEDAAANVIRIVPRRPAC